MKRIKNNGVFYVVISLLACLAVGMGVNAYMGDQAPKVVVEGNYIEASDGGEMGANPGPDKYQRQYFHEGYQSGGDIYATSTVDATITIVAKHVKKDITYLSWTPTATTTVTLMASTSAAMESVNIPNIGDERSYWWYNTSAVTKTSLSQ